MRPASRVGLLLSVLIALSRPASAGTLSYADFDSVLTRFVHDGAVDYGALARERATLDRFLRATQEADPQAWPRNEQLAFWINVYNARVLDGVTRRPGLRSVLDVGKALGVPTLGFFRERLRSGGRDLTLNDIEHEIIRDGFREPRVHFVLNCASASCPPIPVRALQAATLDSTLDSAARSFLADRAKNPGLRRGSLELSSIFKWYRSDFEAADLPLLAFVGRYSAAARGLPRKTTIRFVPYDWSLNGHW